MSLKTQSKIFLIIVVITSMGITLYFINDLAQYSGIVLMAHILALLSFNSIISLYVINWLEK